MHLSAPFVAVLSLSTCAAAGPLSFLRGKSTAAKHAARSSIFDVNLQARNLMTIWVQDQKRQVEANVTVPAYLWQDLMTDYKDLQSAISAYGSVIPELLAFNDTMTSMDAYVTKSG